MRLFRLNSFVKDTGRKEDAEAEPERQQWDDPMEFLMSCISMSVGQLPSVIGVSVHGTNLRHLAFGVSLTIVYSLAGFQVSELIISVLCIVISPCRLWIVYFTRQIDCIAHPHPSGSPPQSLP